jgi:epoxyqueuosine reductase
MTASKPNKPTSSEGQQSSNLAPAGPVGGQPLVADGRRLLLHICCAPCSTYTVRQLRTEGFSVTGYWYNPNIHPFGEHEKRRETLLRYASQIDLPILWEEGYDLLGFLRLVAGRERFRERCLFCYRLRLERAAQVAAQQGFDALTTTLLISPYQDQGALQEIGAEVGRSHGVSFYYEDLRRGFPEHYRLAREHELYMQRYCGCLFSEWEAAQQRAKREKQRHARS